MSAIVQGRSPFPPPGHQRFLARKGFSGFFPGGDGVICTRVACHPGQEVVAAGFADGMVLMAEIASGKVVPVAAPGRGTVSALAWNATGSHLAFGTETGFAALLNLAKA